MRLPIVSGSPTDGGFAGYFDERHEKDDDEREGGEQDAVRAGLARPMRP